MDESRLQELEAKANRFSDERVWAATFEVKDIKDLISEVRRLREENERLRGRRRVHEANVSLDYIRNPFKKEADDE